jgi:hypothetical protein
MKLHRLFLTESRRDPKNFREAKPDRDYVAH